MQRRQTRLPLTLEEIALSRVPVRLRDIAAHVPFDLEKVRRDVVSDHLRAHKTPFGKTAVYVVEPAEALRYIQACTGRPFHVALTA